MSVAAGFLLKHFQGENLLLYKFFVMLIFYRAGPKSYLGSGGSKSLSREGKQFQRCRPPAEKAKLDVICFSL